MIPDLISYAGFAQKLGVAVLQETRLKGNILASGTSTDMMPI